MSPFDRDIWPHRWFAGISLVPLHRKKREWKLNLQNTHRVAKRLWKRVVFWVGNSLKPLHHSDLATFFLPTKLWAGHERRKAPKTFIPRKLHDIDWHCQQFGYTMATHNKSPQNHQCKNSHKIMFFNIKLLDKINTRAIFNHIPLAIQRSTWVLAIFQGWPQHSRSNL